MGRPRVFVVVDMVRGFFSGTKNGFAEVSGTEVQYEVFILVVVDMSDISESAAAK